MKIFKTGLEKQWRSWEALRACQAGPHHLAILPLLSGRHDGLCTLPLPDDVSTAVQSLMRILQRILSSVRTNTSVQGQL